MSEVAPPTASPSRIWFKRALWAVAGLFAAGLLVLAVTTVLIYPELPDTSGLANYHPKLPLRVYTADGVEIGGFGTEKRTYLPIQQIPKLMKDSLLAVEDARFYEHHGIDPIGVLRAILSNITGHRTQGASTITQQVARTFFLTRERTISRKLKEALLSVKMETQLSKDQLLELYMNQIYLGARAYGFAEAAQTYFGKPLDALDAAECAMLAGLPQNPANVNPIKNLDRALARQKVALWRMHEAGVINDAQYDKAKAEKLQIRRPMDVDVHAEYVAEMARQQVVAQFGDAAYTTGLKVYTTLRSADQEAAYKALHRTLIDHARSLPWQGPEDHEDLDPDWQDDDPAVAQVLSDYEDDEDLRVAVVTAANPKALTAVLATGEVIHVNAKGLRQAQAGLSNKAPAALKIRRGSVIRLIQIGKDWSVTQWPSAEGALVAMDPHTGEVRALVGGFDFRHNQFNHVTQGWRQPGSSYKPFLYAGAMEDGVMPETIVNDAPLTDVGDWSPQNADGSADGPITVRQALTHSKNLVTIRLVQLMGADAARQWTGKFGFDVDKQPNNLTLALGAGSTTPMQMAGAYSVIANGGLTVKPVVIRRITDADGKTLFEVPPQVLSEDQRVVPARNTFLISTLLQDVTRFGTAARAQAQLKRPDLYGKTGTTNDVVDAWFAGFQPSLVAVVWVGYDNPKSLGSHASGASLALPIWINYMASALKGQPVAELQPPEGLVHIDGGDWRYSEWANGGFIPSLGLDDQHISPDLIPHPGQAASQPEMILDPLGSENNDGAPR
ncbi:MAG: PBP1A family penicillin-binding protein [Burkholderiales bacterium]|nr:PBP1A family penicillin-binding protein [Burkholderiales bacterium]